MCREEHGRKGRLFMDIHMWARKDNTTLTFLVVHPPHTWAKGGERGGNNPPPRTSKKVLPPLPKILFTAVPPFVTYSQK